MRFYLTFCFLGFKVVKKRTMNLFNGSEDFEFSNFIWLVGNLWLVRFSNFIWFRILSDYLVVFHVTVESIKTFRIG